MTETVEDTRPLAYRDVQDDILCLLKKMSETVENLANLNKTSTEKKVEDLQGYISDIKEIVYSFGQRFTDQARPVESFQKISYLELFPNEKDPKPDAGGKFGKVYFCEFRGQKVAVKILEESNSDDHQMNLKSFKSEVNTLRVISHENIISFRGWGQYKGRNFFVMEHLDKNLYDYVKEQASDDNKGLSSRITWAIAKQLTQAMLYLHSLNIAHADLKPDNIMVDTKPIIPKPKICDFGLARQEFDKTFKLGHVRYLPMTDEVKKVESMDDVFKLDVYAFGLTALFMRTEDTQYRLSTPYIEPDENASLVMKDGRSYVWLPPDLPKTDLGRIIESCCLIKRDRPTFEQIKKEYFDIGMDNPFNLSEKGEFFECGFLKDTQIFVADSMVGDSLDTSFQNSGSPPGYSSVNLICPVKTIDAPYNDQPVHDAKLLSLYQTHYKDFREKARKKEIDDNPMVALEKLITDRSGEEESQKIELRFQQKTYCHHRTMREIWRSFEPKQKEKVVTSLSQVNPLYSNSFGLHVAILTNEGPGKPKKFVFTKRSNRPGVASPGSYTCGAVESCSIKDFLDFEEVEKAKPDADIDFEYISLLNTAARGLEEELGLPLTGNDKEAIVLNTVYLKFDNHEWGMCGFVDLTSAKIQEQNRFSFEKLNAAFTSGPKDKFEHWQIHGVDFELRNMVQWIRENHDKLASSAKIVVVKVLQAFFGVAPVANEFAKKM